MSLRSLPRVFIPGADLSVEVELPQAEIDKLRKVLRLSAGAEIAILPNDGTVGRCEFRGRSAICKEVVNPGTESSTRLTVAQALPKGDKLDEIVRACTEIGVAHFILFASERTIVRWDDKKRIERLRRLEVIAREAAEVSFRTVLPTFELMEDLVAVVKAQPNCVVLSEVEGLPKSLARGKDEATVVVGPEGGWSTKEIHIIGSRGVTLGPRVLRVDHAAPAAAAILLLGSSQA